jgi:putative hydrolase of the HAD superfamily
MDSAVDFALRFPVDIDAVIFDVGGVFTVPSHLRIGDELHKAGIAAPTLSHASVHRGHFVGIRAFERQTHTTEVMQQSDWENYYQVLLQAVGVSDNDLYDGFVAMKALLTHPTLPEHRPSPWSGVIPENVVGLQRLVEAGVPVGVVSNNDGTAPEQLIAVKVAQVGPGPYTPVSVIVDSGTVGVSKPDPAIFTPALEAMGVNAARALYVGDTPHADVRGARAAGMPVVQLDPYNLYAGWDHHRVADVGILADLLLRG